MLKARRKSSIIWTISNEELISIVKNANTLADIFRKLEISSDGNYKTLKRRLSESGIDYSHISLGLDSNKGRKFKRTSVPLDEILIENSSYCRTHLKARLIRESFLEEICSICGISNIWNKKKLSLVLDHINGISNDNRIENLRLLCPNCNSQQETFSGRNKSRRIGVVV